MYLNLNFFLIKDQKECVIINCLLWTPLTMSVSDYSLTNRLLNIDYAPIITIIAPLRTPVAMTNYVSNKARRGGTIT